MHVVGHAVDGMGDSIHGFDHTAEVGVEPISTFSGEPRFTVFGAEHQMVRNGKMAGARERESSRTPTGAQRVIVSGPEVPSTLCEGSGHLRLISWIPPA